MNKYCYVILNPRGGLLVEDPKLPIYWNKKVAEERLKCFKGHTLEKVNLKNLLELINQPTQPVK